MHLRQSISGAAASAAALLIGAGWARADVYGLSGGLQGPGVVAFDSAGRYAGRAFAGIKSADGIAATPDGWLYVNGNGLGLGQLGRSRAAMPLAFHAVTDLAENGYNVPAGLAAGPDGSVYATSTAFRQDGFTGVLRYDPADQTFLPVVTNAVASPGPGLNGFNAAVAVAPGGDLFVYRRGLGIERYSGATGQFVATVVPAAALAGAPTYDLDLGPDGNLYVPAAGGVDRFDAQTGALIDHFIPNGVGGLNGATSLAFGGDGLLYVNSPAAHSILRYDATTGAFHDAFVAQGQYDLANLGGVGQIVYAVPEPGTLTGIMALAGALLLRRRAVR